jgi:hypothetical protein
MGPKTPTRTIEKVLRFWLSGFSREKIAEKAGIGEGTVSSIIQEAKKNLPDIDLLRQVAVQIKRKGWELAGFASAMRHRNILYKKGLTDDQIDSLIEIVDEHCFKRDMTLEWFVDLIGHVALVSDKYNCPIEKLDELKDEMEAKMTDLDRGVAALESFKQQIMIRNQITENDIEYYKENLPLIETLRKRDEDIKLVKAQMTLFGLQWMMVGDIPKDSEGTNLFTERDILEAAQLLLRNPPQLVSEIRSILEKKNDLPLPLAHEPVPFNI